MAGANSPGRHFIQWRLTFVGLQYKTCFMSPFLAWNFGVASRFLENLWIMI